MFQAEASAAIAQAEELQARLLANFEAEARARMLEGAQSEAVASLRAATAVAASAEAAMQAELDAEVPRGKGAAHASLAGTISSVLSTRLFSTAPIELSQI